MGKLAENYLYNLAYQLLVLIAPIITAPYLARVLGATNLGIYSYVSSSGNIVTTIALLGIYTYGNRQIAYEREDKEKLTNTFWELEILRVILGLIGTLIYVVYICLNLEYARFFLIYYPYILAQFIDCSWLYVGLENMKPAVMKNFITKLINILGIFIFVKVETDLWIYISLLAITTLIGNISIYTQLTKYVGKPQVNLRDLKKHLSGSLTLFLPQVASLFYLQVDKVMLEWLTNRTDQLSFYDQAEKIVTIPLSLITVISSVIMPRLANEYHKNNKKKLEDILLRAGKYALCMAMPMMLGVFVIARQFIPWYLGTDFIDTAIAIMILAPIILLNSLAAISGKQYFTATDQTQILLKAYIIAAVMNICINAILIPKYGYVGAAVATVMSSLGSVVTQYYYLSKEVEIKRLGKYGVKYFLGAMLMTIGIVIFSYQRKASISTTFLQIVIGVGIYSIYLWITRDSVVKEIFAMMKRKNKK